MSTLGSLTRMPRLCVYCGSNVGSDPAFRGAAHALGEAMARRGIGLVYGGGQVGLMGIMADAVLAGGGEVIGVITDQLVSAEVAHRGLSSLEVVPDMHQRKARFEQLADGFIALPGGFGTVEEVIELLTWNQLGLVRKPVVLLDVERYWGAVVRLDGQRGRIRIRAQLASHAAHSAPHRRRGVGAGARSCARDTGQVDRSRYRSGPGHPRTSRPALVTTGGCGSGDVGRAPLDDVSGPQHACRVHRRRRRRGAIRIAIAVDNASCVWGGATSQAVLAGATLRHDLAGEGGDVQSQCAQRAPLEHRRLERAVGRRLTRLADPVGEGLPVRRAGCRRRSACARPRPGTTPSRSTVGPRTVTPCVASTYQVTGFSSKQSPS